MGGGGREGVGDGRGVAHGVGGVPFDDAPVLLRVVLHEAPVAVLRVLNHQWEQLSEYSRDMEPAVRLLTFQTQVAFV